MAKKKFSFKSSGKLVTARELTEFTPISKPIGIKTPLEFNIGRGDEDFLRMHYDPANQVKDNLNNLLLTGFGERLGRAKFGPNLKQLLFDLTSTEVVEAEAIKRITESVRKYMSMVAITDIKIAFKGLNDTIAAGNEPTTSIGLAVMTIRVYYDVPRIKVQNQAIEVILTCAG